MSKRYQVFISSTFIDLAEMRREIYQVLMEMDCIPAGMELFLSADEEQFSFIKSVIDDSDYYILLIAGRYGTIAGDGVSFTEKEYDYAVSKGKHVLAFIHDDRGSLLSKFTDSSDELKEKLNKFIEKVSSGRLVTNWNQTKDLPGLVARSLHKAIKIHPAIGWVRADSVASGELLSELHEAKKEIESLRGELEGLKASPRIMLEGLAGLDEYVTFKYTYYLRGQDRVGQCKFQWGEIFTFLSPYFFHGLPKYDLDRKINDFLRARAGVHASVDEEFLETLAIQFMAIGLVSLVGISYSLTPFGEKKMYEMRAVKSAESR